METIKIIIEKFIIALVRFYQVCISPLTGPSCRHLPTCSEYTIEAIKTRGWLKGSILSIKRLLNCRPGGTSGYDPVPTLKDKK